MRKPVFRVSDAYRAVQPQKMDLGRLGTVLSMKREQSTFTMQLICDFVFAYMQKAGFHMKQLITLLFYFIFHIQWDRIKTVHD